MARPFVAPPGVSADKAALLRRAFDATMQDGEFRAEAARMKADLAPTTGEDVQKLVARIYATPRPVVDRLHAELKTILAQPDVKEAIVKYGYVAMDAESVDELKSFITSEIALWSRVVQQAGIAGSE